MTSETTSVIIAKLDTLSDRLKAVEDRTKVLEEFSVVMTTLRDHETILRGPDRNDGLITQMIALNAGLETQVKRVDGIFSLIKAIVIPLSITVTVSIGGFVWGLLTHAITLTLGK